MAFMEEDLDMPVRQLLQIMQDRTVERSTYFGVRAVKSPTDFWVYQEIMAETKPDLIIEIGNFHGGSTLALAHLCDNFGKGTVIGLDISHQFVPNIVRVHPRITLIEGDACALFPQVSQLAKDAASILIIEDSSHTYENTLNVLRTFSPLVKPDGYFIVEDSICHHGLVVGPNPGPYEAIETFMDNNQDFEIDRSRESFFITWNPKGYLRRRSVS
ncbi:MAG: CmcI family methyltransferase [Chloroflexota bacterium]